MALARLKPSWELAEVNYFQGLHCYKACLIVPTKGTPLTSRTLWNCRGCNSTSGNLGPRETGLLPAQYATAISVKLGTQPTSELESPINNDPLQGAGWLWPQSDCLTVSYFLRLSPFLPSLMWLLTKSDKREACSLQTMSLQTPNNGIGAPPHSLTHFPLHNSH